MRSEVAESPGNDLWTSPSSGLVTGVWLKVSHVVLIISLSVILMK